MRKELWFGFILMAIIIVLILMFRPTGLLGESLGKARA